MDVYNPINMKNSMERPFSVERGRQIPVQSPEIPEPAIYAVPAPDGPYIFSQRVLSRDTSPDFVQKEYRAGFGVCELKGVSRNPLDEFTPARIYGASYDVGDFFSTPEHGWAKVIKEIILPKITTG